MSAPGTTTVAVGQLVHDVRRDRVGVVQAQQGGRWFVRPQGGGREWEATAGELEFVTAEEALRLRVAEANAHSRGERP